MGWHRISDGIKGEKSSSARIIHIVDVMMLRTERTYKKPIPRGEYKILEEGKGVYFDPEILEVFLANESKFKEIYNNF